MKPLCLTVLLWCMGMCFTAHAQPVVHNKVWKVVHIDSNVSVDFPIAPSRGFAEKTRYYQTKGAQLGGVYNPIGFTISGHMLEALPGDMQRAYDSVVSVVGRRRNDTTEADLRNVLYKVYITGKAEQANDSNLKSAGLLLNNLHCCDLLYTTNNLFYSVITRERIFFMNDKLYSVKMIYGIDAEPNYIKELWDIMMASLDVKRVRMEATGTEVANH